MIKVTVQCIQCKEKKDIGPGEVEEDDVPMCQKCFMPMVPVEAHTK